MGRRRSFTEAAGSGALSVSDVPAAPTNRVRVAECVARPDNPRPDHVDVAELAASIRESGQIQPVTIVSADAYLQQRPAHTEMVGEAAWVVLAGSRRLAAAREAGVEELLVHVADDRVDEVIEVGIIENIQREPLTPVREGYELAQLVERYGTTRAVGEKIGKSHVYVSQRISLTKLVLELQTAVDNGQLKVQDARTLAKLPQGDQLEAYQAGPPYDQRAAAPRDNGGSPNGKTTAASTAPVGNDVSKNPEGSPGEDSPQNVSGNVVSKPQPIGREGAVPPTLGSDVSKHHAEQSPTATLPTDPADLALVIQTEYSAEQRAALLSLLQE